MAVAFNLSDVRRFPEGTSVKAYPVSNWPSGIVDTSAAPVGTETETQTVTNGTAAFVALTDNTEYVAYAAPNSVKTYTFFTAGQDIDPSDDVAHESELGTIATQDADAVAITGGTVAGITDLAVTDGGTGASSASTARTNLGVSLPTSGTHTARLAATPTAGLLYKETDTGLVYLGNGSSWQIWKGEGGVRKTGDETVTNSATLQNDDHLFFPIEPNEVWWVEAYLLGQGASANADFKFGWTGPTGATAQWGALSQTNNVSGAWVTLGPSSANNFLAISDTVALGGQSGKANYALMGVFVADASHAGTIQFQWAQNTQTNEDNKILTNSFLRLRRLA